MKSQFPTLIAFADPGAVVAYLHRTPGDLDAKDTLLGELVLAAQSGRHGELPSSLLWLGLWPGLDAIYNRRRKHFPRFLESWSRASARPSRSWSVVSTSAPSIASLRPSCAAPNAI